MKQLDSIPAFLIILILCVLFWSGCNTSEEENRQEEENQESIVLDRLIRARLELFDLEAESTIEQVNEVTLLGEMLFKDKNLSGNNDIACITCHQIDSSTENIALSIGTGGEGEDINRTQESGAVIKRHTPHLFNISQQENMFHDGRVSFIDGSWNLPSALPASYLNEMDKALDAQTLFPLLSRDEMRGQSGQNDIAALNVDTEVLEHILNERVLNNDDYLTAFQSAYPSATSFNPGHMAHALGEFTANKFIVRDTPYDRYLNGNDSALTNAQKRGFLLFMGRGECIRCHSGKNLTDNQFHSVGVPHIFDSNNPTDDLGRFEFSGDVDDIYTFKTPGLRGIALTAPYMHNGAFQTLEEVVDHYNNIERSLLSYSIDTDLNAPYNANLSVDRNTTRNNQRLNQVPFNQLRNGLRLNRSEREDLVEFLKSLN